MTPGEFIRITLRLARDAMHPPARSKNWERAILCAIPAGQFLSVREIGALIDVELNSLASMVFRMHKKRLLDRIGDRGDYRYTVSADGRALCE